MEESVLLGTKPLVESIRHFILDPSGVFSVCHLCECRIVQWRHDSRLLLLLNWSLHIIKRTLHVGSKIWILCSRGKNNISLEHKIHIFSPPCNILYLFNLCICTYIYFILSFYLQLMWRLIDFINLINVDVDVESNFELGKPLEHKVHLRVASFYVSLFSLLHTIHHTAWLLIASWDQVSVFFLDH